MTYRVDSFVFICTSEIKGCNGRIVKCRIVVWPFKFHCKKRNRRAFKCLHIKTKSPSIFLLFMCASKTSRVDWKSVDGAFPKPRRLHLVEDSDGLIRCPIAGCDHPASRIFTPTRMS